METSHHQLHPFPLSVPLFFFFSTSKMWTNHIHCKKKISPQHHIYWKGNQSNQALYDESNKKLTWEISRSFPLRSSTFFFPPSLLAGTPETKQLKGKQDLQKIMIHKSTHPQEDSHELTDCVKCVCVNRTIDGNSSWNSRLKLTNYY